MKKVKITNNGKKGGTLVGKKHNDKNGNPIGGIKAVVGDVKKPVELEGGEVIINAEASKLNWKLLSEINQSAGNGVPILPPDEFSDNEEEYKKGGNIIKFKPNNIPAKQVYTYALKIKKEYPHIWAKGGNIFGNEAFKLLEKVVKRGYWLEEEEWFYIKWQSFCARHSGDFRIEGVIANLKWLNKVDKGFDYMKSLIQSEVDKKEVGGNIDSNSEYIEKLIKKATENGYFEELKKGASEESEEHKKTLKDLFNKIITPEEASYSIANEHLKKDHKYYTKLSEMEKLEMSAEGKIGRVMSEFYTGKLKNSAGQIVKDKKQALAIAFSEQRKHNKKMKSGGNVSHYITIAVDGDKKMKMFHGNLSFSDLFDKGFIAEKVENIPIFEQSEPLTNIIEFAESKIYNKFRKHIDLTTFIASYKQSEDGIDIVEISGNLLDQESTPFYYDNEEFDFKIK